MDMQERWLTLMQKADASVGLSRREVRKSAARKGKRNEQHDEDQG